MVSAVVPPIIGEAVGAMPTTGMWAPSLLVALSFIEDVLFWGALLLPTLPAAIILSWLVRWVIALLRRRTQSPAHAPGIIVCVSVGMLLFLVYALDLLDSHSSLWGLKTLLGLLLLLVTGLRLRHVVIPEGVMPSGTGRRRRPTLAVGAVLVAVVLVLYPLGQRATTMVRLRDAYNRDAGGEIVRCCRLPSGMYIDTRHVPCALFPELDTWYGLAAAPWPAPGSIRCITDLWRWRYVADGRPTKILQLADETDPFLASHVLRLLMSHDPKEQSVFSLLQGRTRLAAWAVDRSGRANLFVLVPYTWKRGQTWGGNCAIVRLIDDGLGAVRAEPFVDLGFGGRKDDVHAQLVDLRARSADDRRGMELALTTQYEEAWSSSGYLIFTEDDLASFTAPIDLAIDKAELPPGLHLRELSIVQGDSRFQGTAPYARFLPTSSPPLHIVGRASGILWLRWNLCLVRRD